MGALRLLLVLLLCSAAAQAAEIQSLIDRPVTLPQGKIDLTLHGTYTDWGNGIFGETQAVDGETLAFGVDIGATDGFQFGLGLALPIHPGAAFGSVLVSTLFRADPRAALRLDVGFEHIGINGNPSQVNTSHANRYFGGLGAAVKVPITEKVAFVTGRNGAVPFGHFQNVGAGATGFFFGATELPQASSDFLIVSQNDTGSSSTVVGINLPAGLLVQLGPLVAMTLQAGYSVVIESSGTATGILHFVPLALEAVVSPAPPLDIGARFSLDGYVGASDARFSLGAGYFDLRALMLWIRFHL